MFLYFSRVRVKCSLRGDITSKISIFMNHESLQVFIKFMIIVEKLSIEISFNLNLLKATLKPFLIGLIYESI